MQTTNETTDETLIAPQVAAPTQRPRRSGFRFSLRTALVVMVFLVLTVSHLYTSRQLFYANEELIRYRSELGHLKVVNETRVNLIAVPNYQDLVWQWRLFVPEGQNLLVHCRMNDIPDTGFPESTNAFHGLQSGESLLTVAFYRNPAGQWSRKIAINAVHGGGTSGVHRVSDHEMSWYGGGYSQVSGAATTQRTFDADQPIELLRYRTWKTAPANRAEEQVPTDGFQIWLAPDVP